MSEIGNQKRERGGLARFFGGNDDATGTTWSREVVDKEPVMILKYFVDDRWSWRTGDVVSIITMVVVVVVVVGGRVQALRAMMGDEAEEVREKRNKSGGLASGF